MSERESGTEYPHLLSPVSCIPCPRPFFLGFFPLSTARYYVLSRNLPLFIPVPPLLVRQSLAFLLFRSTRTRPSPLSSPTVDPVIFLMWVACELFKRDFCLERPVQLNCSEELQRYAKTGNKKHATCFPTLLQNELNSEVARFTTHVQTCQQPDLLQDRFDVGGKTRNIAIQLVLQQCCKTSCMIFVARFSVP